MSDQTYTIENVAGVAHAELRLRPGVNVLRGANGAGKTSAIRAITRAQGGAVELERRDGTEFGTVEGPGVKLKIGKVVRTTGVAELSLADTSPLSRLIDPRLADSTLAARARIRALVEMLGLGMDDATLARLVPEPELREWLRDFMAERADAGLMDWSEALRNHAHAVARVHESAAETAEGRAQAAQERAELAIAAAGGEGALVTETVEAAQAALVDGGRRYERAVAQAGAREQLEAQQAEIRATLGPRPDTEAALERLMQMQERWQAAGGTVTRIEAELAAARMRLADVDTEEQFSRREAESLSLRASQWDDAQKVLAQPAVGPARADLPAIEAETVGAASIRLMSAQHSAEARAANEAHAQAAQERAREAKEAARLRGIAASLPARLGAILAAAGAPGLTVVDGRLAAVIDGEVRDFELRLSTGQQVAAALAVAGEVYRDHSVPLDGASWAALDPANRAEFARLAAERGLHVVTESPSDGPLRVEHVGAY